jgi:hypothetical protein
MSTGFMAVGPAGEDNDDDDDEEGDVEEEGKRPTWAYREGKRCRCTKPTVETRHTKIQAPTRSTNLDGRYLSIEEEEEAAAGG